MHPQAYQFVEKTMQNYPIKGKKVLEIGSLNVNGTVRPLFEGCALYTGIDIRKGRDVDIVTDAREYNGKRAFDIVVTCETLEHDLEPEVIIQCAWRALKKGGLLIITAAATGRAAHNHDGTSWIGKEPYKNIDPIQFKELLAEWEDVQITHNKDTCDLYAVATKPERRKL